MSDFTKDAELSFARTFIMLALYKIEDYNMK